MDIFTFGGLSVVISLALLESLLSVDNALVLAEMVRHLPPKQQQLALRAGMIGAYVMRGICIAFAYIIIENPWVKVLGGTYLIYLACKNLAIGEDGESNSHHSVNAGFWGTVVAVEVADLTFSIDNIAAAAAFTKNIWLIFAGVAIGILAMRFVAQKLIDVIDRFPVLGKVAYVLIAWIGFQLFIERFAHIELGEVFKFLTIVFIVAVGICYEKNARFANVARPVFIWAGQQMGNFAELVDGAISPVKWLLSRYRLIHS